MTGVQTCALPIFHRGYQGEDLVLPDDPSSVLRLRDHPALATQVGHDIVTASGTTLLGADNKSGVAEIMTAAEYLLAHPEIPHGAIRIAFTPDEEVGRGTAYFDVGRFGAHCAYTMDGGQRGELEYESFSADAITITFNEAVRLVAGNAVIDNDNVDALITFKKTNAAGVDVGFNADRKSTRLNSSHMSESRMPSSA